MVPSPQILFTTDEFIREAWSHGKAIGAFGNGSQIITNAGLAANSSMGIFAGDAATVTTQGIGCVEWGRPGSRGCSRWIAPAFVSE